MRFLQSNGLDLLVRCLFNNFKRSFGGAFCFVQFNFRSIFGTGCENHCRTCANKRLISWLHEIKSRERREIFYSSNLFESDKSSFE